MRADISPCCLSWLGLGAWRLLSAQRVSARCIKRELALHLCIVWMQRYISLRERARAWNLAPMWCGMTTEMILQIASFAPLAGARMMCTSRGSYSVCNNFLQFVIVAWGLRGVYLFAMRRFLGENVRGRCNSALGRQIQHLATSGYGMDLEMQIAAVAELGGDADLVFALALILADEVAEQAGHPVSDYWWGSSSEACHGSLGPPLYAACGPTGCDAVVSLLIRLGAPVWGRKAIGSVLVANKEIKENALCRAVRLEKQSTVCILLRASAVTASHGMDRRCFSMGSMGWASALYVAATSGHGGIIGALLGARACPSRTNAFYMDRLRVDKMSAWEYKRSGDERGALVLEAFLACERRCRCGPCTYISKFHSYR